MKSKLFFIVLSLAWTLQPHCAAGMTITNTVVIVLFPTNTQGNTILTVESQRFMSDGRVFPSRYAVAPASRESTVATNDAGYLLVLSASTNRFLSGSSITVWLTVANASTNALTGWQAVQLPKNIGIGELLVTNVSTGAWMPFSGDPVPSWVSDYEVTAPAPGQARNFPFLLHYRYGVRPPGTYEVRFAAKLPSPFEPGKRVEFDTPPLVLTLLGTNQPVQPAPNTVPR